MRIRMVEWLAMLFGVWGLAANGLGGQQPAALTPEQQQLRQEALKLNQEGVALYNQARLPEATDRLRKALERFQQVYPRDKYPTGHPELAASLGWLGLLLQAQGEYAKAEPFYRQALEMNQTLYPKDKYPTGHPGLAECLNNLGSLLQAQGAYAKAEPFYRQALEMRQALYPKSFWYPNGHPGLAESHNNLGLLLKAQGEYAKAEPFVRQALQMNQTLYPRDKYPTGHPHLALSLNNLGFLLQAQGEYAKAEPFLRQALEMFQALYPRDKYPTGHPQLALSLNNLGFLLQAQGEYAKAEPFLRQALEMFQALYPRDKYPTGHPQLALSLNNLGFLLQAQREYAKTEPFFRQALEMRQTLYPRDKYPTGHPNLALSLNNLGFLLQAQGEYAKAEPFFRQALEIYQALYPRDKYPTGHPELSRSLHNLGALFKDQGEYAKAEPFFRQALEMYQALYPKDQYPTGHPQLATSLNALGSLLQDQGEYAKAEPFFRQALEIYQQRAEQLARTAPEALALNHAATFPLTRDALLSTTRQLPDSDTRSYAAIWFTKAALTRVYQRRHLALVAAASDEGIAQAYHQLQRLRRQRERLLLAATSAGSSARDDQLRQLNDAIDKAEKDLVPRLPALKHHEDLANLGPDALQKRLPPDAVLVDFLRYVYIEQDPVRPGLTGERRSVRYLAFIVSKQEVTRLELGTAKDVEEAVRSWREAITARVPAEDKARRDHEAKLDRQSGKVRQLLWEPIHKQLPSGTRTVYLAPDAALTRLPWAALPGQKQNTILLDDYALAVLPHGPFLLEQLMPVPPRTVSGPVADGLVLAGGIRFDDKPELAPGTTRAPATGTEGKLWSFLKGTEEERLLLRKLAGTSGAKVTALLSGAEASVDRLRQELPRARFAHLATHGFFADQQFRSVLQLDEKLFERRLFATGNLGERIGEGARSPLVLSGLVCAGANLPDTPDRGILSADAIAGLLLDDLQLAVLSACDTGLGDVAGGEGVYGLQRAFHIAGCKNVVASLWKVDDAATAALMTRFYGYLWVDKQPPIEALRKAQLDMYRHPEMIPRWAQGERAPGLPKPATTPTTPTETMTSSGRAPVKLWAAFTLSGVGR